MIRVLLVDDQALVRAGFHALLASAADIEVVGEAANGEEAIHLARQTWPDVVLMDIRMPVLDGLEATRRIVADPQLSGVKVLILTTFEIDEYVFEALRAGASGFVLKDIESQLSCCRPCGSSPAVRRCYHPRSPDGSSLSSPPGPNGRELPQPSSRC